MKYFIFLCVSSLCVSCVHHSSQSTPYPHLARADAIVMKSDRELAENGFYELSVKYQYRTLIGGLEKSYGTRKHRFTSSDEVRSFFCAFMEKYLRPLNDEMSLRPYLEHYPLTWKDINLSLVFFDEAGKPLTKPYIAAIRNIKDTLYYEYCDPQTGKYIAYATEEMDHAFKAQDNRF